MLKIFDAFSPIVTILIEVVVDLGKFLLLFIIVVALFSIVFGALGIGNNPSNQLHDFDEFRATGLLVGNVINTLQQAIGAFGLFGIAA